MESSALGPSKHCGLSNARTASALGVTLSSGSSFTPGSSTPSSSSRGNSGATSSGSGTSSDPSSREGVGTGSSSSSNKTSSTTDDTTKSNSTKSGSSKSESGSSESGESNGGSRAVPAPTNVNGNCGRCVQIQSCEGRQTPSHNCMSGSSRPRWRCSDGAFDCSVFCYRLIGMTVKPKTQPTATSGQISRFNFVRNR
jgi:hypothetical protein